MLKKVYFFETDHKEQEYFTHHLGSKADLNFSPDRLTTDMVEDIHDAEIISSFIYSDLSIKILDQLPHLKGIATMSVGVDHINMDEADRRHVTVCNVPAYGPNTVAEHTIALLLAMSRNIVSSIERTRAGVYDYSGLIGWDVMGKTIGIIGTGKIGSRVARIAWGLEMKVIAYDLHPNPDLTNRFGVEYVTLDELYTKSDVITIHTPLNNGSRHMIGGPEFSKMKKGAVLLNTARGGLIDPQALIEALNDGKISQAGIDVLDDERLLKEEKQFFSKYFQMKDYQTALADQALMRDPRVLVTPHNAFNSREALENILKTTVQNIEGLLTDDPINIVNV